MQEHEQGQLSWGHAYISRIRSEGVAAAQAIGAELDLTDKGLGIRSRRYTLLAEDGVVRS